MGLGTEVTPANGVGIPIRLTFCATLGLWTLPGAMLVCWTCDLCCKGRISTPWSDEANMWSGVWLRFPPLWLECGDPFMYWGLNFPWKLKFTPMPEHQYNSRTLITYFYFFCRSCLSTLHEIGWATQPIWTVRSPLMFHLACDQVIVNNYLFLNIFHVIKSYLFHFIKNFPRW